MDYFLCYEILEKKLAQLQEEMLLLARLEGDIKVGGRALQSLFDMIPIPLFYKDINGIYKYCNDAFAETVIGLEKDKIVNASAYGLPGQISKERADLYQRRDAELLKKVARQNYETKVKCADGIERYYHFYKLTIAVDNDILGILGSMLDVSEYKNTLQELTKINAVLI